MQAIDTASNGERCLTLFALRRAAVDYVESDKLRAAATDFRWSEPRSPSLRINSAASRMTSGGFVAVSDVLGRKFDSERFRVRKPTYYLTDRAGISHVSGARVFLRAARVVDSPAIAVHETAHLLLGTDPAAPRNLPITPPEIEATTGVWLAEGFASHVATQLAPRRGLLLTVCSCGVTIRPSTPKRWSGWTTCAGKPSFPTSAREHMAASAIGHERGAR